MLTALTSSNSFGMSFNIELMVAQPYCSTLMQKSSRFIQPRDNLGLEHSGEYGGGSHAVPCKLAANKAFKNAYFQHVPTSPNSAKGIWLSIPMFYTSKKNLIMWAFRRPKDFEIGPHMAEPAYR